MFYDLDVPLRLLGLLKLNPLWNAPGATCCAPGGQMGAAYVYNRRRRGLTQQSAVVAEGGRKRYRWFSNHITE